MRILIVVFILLIVLALGVTETVSAKYCVAENSATLKNESSTYKYDYRVLSLRDFLESHNSPLASYSGTFIKEADHYGLDWRLVPAITGVESTFGKNIPTKSYNAYGWANGKFRFSSWEESIFVVNKALRERYINRGATSIAKIGRIYATNPTWAWKVSFFMLRIEPYPITFDI